MSGWIILIIAIPLLFVVGVVYNAIKAQRKLEREMLPEIIKEREEERERIRKSGLIGAHSEGAAQGTETKRADPWDDDDDWPVRTPASSDQQQKQQGQ